MLRRFVCNVFVAIGIFQICVMIAGCDQAPTKSKEETQKQADYLPLRVRQRWDYDYFYGFRQTALFDSVMSGSLVWIVQSVDTINNPKRYTVQATVAGRSIKFDRRYGTSDTAVVSPATSTFLIQEDRNHALMIAPAFFASRIEFADSLKRYDTATQDTASARYAIRHAYEYIELVRNVGVTYWAFGPTGNFGARGSITLRK